MSMITVIGNLVFEPESRQAAGHALTKLRVASNDRIKDASGEWKDSDTTYVDVSCWRRLAEGAATLKKGQRVVVYGKLKGRSFQRQDGTSGYAYEIEATEIGASIMPKGGDAPAPVAKKIEPDLDAPWGE